MSRRLMGRQHCEEDVAVLPSRLLLPKSVLNSCIPNQPLPGPAGTEVPLRCRVVEPCRVFDQAENPLGKSIPWCWSSIAQVSLPNKHGCARRAQTDEQNGTRYGDGAAACDRDTDQRRKVTPPTREAYPSGGCRWRLRLPSMRFLVL